MGDEEEPAADAAMQRAADEGGVVPRIWWYEVRNALLMNERRSRISTQQVSDTLAASLALGVLLDDRHDDAQVLSLAREFNLTGHDSAYLEIADTRCKLKSVHPKIISCQTTTLLPVPVRRCCSKHSDIRQTRSAGCGHKRQVP